jgi:hypothetical protein
VRVVDGPLEGEFVSLPMGCPFPVRLPKKRPTARPMMFDPHAATQISGTTSLLLVAGRTGGGPAVGNATPT